jgi:hypothetical protein
MIRQKIQLGALANSVNDLSKFAVSSSPSSAAPDLSALGSAVQLIANNSKEISSQIQEDKAGTTVWSQFYGISRDKAEAIAQALHKDFRLPGIEQTPVANNGLFLADPGQILLATGQPRRRPAW